MDDIWQNCYNDGWQGDIVPEAFSHPAKFSRGLIHRIYQHAKDMQWVMAGDWVLDPFGGIALGGLDAIAMGLNWIGVELEEKFVFLGQQNIELWSRQLKGWPNLGTARIVQGDSRRLKEQFSMQGSCRPVKCDCLNGHSRQSEDCSLIISSPPYADQLIQKNSGSIDRKKQYKTYRSQGGGASFEAFCRTQDLHSTDYGHTPGNLANMKEGSIDAVISSPPYSEIRQDGGSSRDGIKGLTNYSGEPRNYWPTQRDQKNLGNVPPDTFWEASREIVQQCFELLKPNGKAIWVCKDYCKDGKRIPFSKRWATLCESVGFKIIHWHKAMLVKPEGEQDTIRGTQYLETERKSFFRRNHETKIKAAKFWPTLDIDIQNEFLAMAQKQVNVKPTEKKILQKAQVLAFKSECLDDRPYENEIMIDFEDVICLVKE